VAGLLNSSRRPALPPFQIKNLPAPAAGGGVHPYRQPTISPAASRCDGYHSGMAISKIFLKSICVLEEFCDTIPANLWGTCSKKTTGQAVALVAVPIF
jgi:hypothetical protein